MKWAKVRARGQTRVITYNTTGRAASRYLQIRELAMLIIVFRKRSLRERFIDEISLHVDHSNTISNQPVTNATIFGEIRPKLS